MGFFNLFGKRKKASQTTDNGISGPTFFDGLTEHMADPKDLQEHEWRRKLKAASGETKFKIKYYGKLHAGYPNLIIGTDTAPALVIAVEPVSGQEILLFDGCIHGYNAMFCDEYSESQKKDRKAETIYQASDGHDVFEIIISTYHGIDYDDEFSSMVDKEGRIELLDGTKVEFEIVKRNGFDTLQIKGITEVGEVVEIVSEELA